MKRPGQAGAPDFVCCYKQSPSQSAACGQHSSIGRKKGQVMSNIVKFPRRTNATVVQSPVTLNPGTEAPTNSNKKTSASVMVMLQFAVALLWPVLKWVLAIDVTWQFVRMLYFWNTPDTYAGLAFLLHFSAFTALTYFVAVYRPRGGVGH